MLVLSTAPPEALITPTSPPSSAPPRPPPHLPALPPNTHVHTHPQLHIAQPTPPEAISILRGLRARYEKHHALRITDAALVAAVELSHRYTADRFLPDKVRVVCARGCMGGGLHS